MMSQWLCQENTTSRLPLGPTHQIGVGMLVLNPNDPSQMLVVQECTGPAAAFGLWKMPTGLLDPGEDIPDAAVRELQEETSLQSRMDGIVCFRQAHSPTGASDLFFVCRMELIGGTKWKIQESEIADIQWMSVQEYCNQDRWQGSPVYKALNDCILKVSQQAAARTITKQQHQHEHEHKHPTGATTMTTNNKNQRKNACHDNGLILHEKLPLGFAKTTNALFRSQL